LTESPLATLALDGLSSGYGQRQVLEHISLTVGASEVVAVIGHNGAGKSTVLKVIFGLLPAWSGRVVYANHDITSASIRARLRSGIVYVPQGQRVFEELTVAEHLSLPRVVLRDRALVRQRFSDVLDWFPALTPLLRRNARTLSGGEKQMLALAMAMMHRPRLLLLDEPSLGLAPPLVSETMKRLSQLNREWGTAMLVVEQKVREVIRLASRVYVLAMGKVVYSSDTIPLIQDPSMLSKVFL